MSALQEYQSQITENDVKRNCINLLVSLGWPVIRVNSGAKTETDSQTGRTRHYKFCIWQAPGFLPQSAGVSDLLAIQPDDGRLWVIECKKPGKLGNLTQSQKYFHQAAKEAGAVVITVDSQEMLIEALHKYIGWVDISTRNGT